MSGGDRAPATTGGGGSLASPGLLFGSWGLGNVLDLVPTFTVVEACSMPESPP